LINHAKRSDLARNPHVTVRKIDCWSQRVLDRCEQSREIPALLRKDSNTKGAKI